MSLFDDDDIDDDDVEATAAPIHSGLPEAKLNPDLIGHADAESQIIDWWSKGKMPHSLVLGGPKGIGKSTLAFRLARFLMAEQPDAGLFGAPEIPTSLALPASHPMFSLIGSGGHPDMMVVEREFDEAKGVHRDAILVDDVRGVPGFLRMTASMGGWRVVIVNDADTLNRNAQNALLKVLEEPPARSLLMLVTHSVGALIPTIRSRSRVLTLDALDATNFAGIMKRAAPELMPGDIDLMMEFSAGAPGQALDLLEQGGIPGIRGVLSLFETLPSADDRTLYTAAEKLSVRSNPDPLMGMLDVSAWTLADRARKAAQNDQISAMRGWLDTLDALAAHRAMCDKGNLDRRHMAFGALRILQKGLKAA